MTLTTLQIYRVDHVCNMITRNIVNLHSQFNHSLFNSKSFGPLFQHWFSVCFINIV